jgi:AAHS family 4-hydroxybenzoate transporter-like MFS transporter
MPESRETLGEAAPRAAVADLFTGGRAPLTVWLWLASFMTWTTLIVMAFWTPPLLQRAGWSASAAATVLAINNAGGVVGTILLGATLTRVRPHHALMLTLLAAAGFLALMGASTGSFAGLAAAAAFAGFFASASGGALLAVSAAAYPAEARATGVGWALGFGRIGAVVGPMAAGLLVTLQWPVPRLYLAIAAPALAAAGLVFLLSRSPAFARSGAASTPPTLH